MESTTKEISFSRIFFLLTTSNEDKVRVVVTEVWWFEEQASPLFKQVVVFVCSYYASEFYPLYCYIISVMMPGNVATSNINLYAQFCKISWRVKRESIVRIFTVQLKY